MLFPYIDFLWIIWYYNLVAMSDASAAWTQDIFNGDVMVAGSAVFNSENPKETIVSI